MPDPLTIDLIKTLLRKGALSVDDVNAMADGLEADGEQLSAEAARVVIIEADVDYSIARRARLHVIYPYRDGGNDTG